jgi:PIN domain nuclease of toxin-antitoxin system
LRLLLDTHALIWWFAGDERLSASARRAIEENADVFVSAATAWELTTKYRLGKLPNVASIVRDLAAAVADQGFRELPINLRHGDVAGSLPGPHRDPFDRMLIAQAIVESLVLVTNESVFATYGVALLW